MADTVAQPGTGGACWVAEAVRLRRVARAKGPAIDFPDAPILSCPAARAVAAWTASVAGPILEAERGAPLVSVRTGPGFECRPRNRQPGAKMSAHGTGLALDVAGFAFANGRTLTIGSEEGRTSAGLAAARRAACGWFTTVLGPGSDPFHGDHLHLDMMLHGTTDRYRICQ